MEVNRNSAGQFIIRCSKACRKYFNGRKGNGQLFHNHSLDKWHTCLMDLSFSFQGVASNSGGHTEEVTTSVNSSSRNTLSLVEEGWFLMV